MRKASPLVYRSLVMGHVVGFALFLGGTLAVAALGLAGDSIDQGLHRAFAFDLAARLQLAIVVPGAAMTLLSGVLLSVLGPWGFTQYRWVLAKVLGTAILAVHSQVSFRPLTGQLRDMAQLATRLGALPVGYADLFIHFQRVALIQVVVLLVLAGLGVYKPWGKTRRPQGVKEKIGTTGAA